MDDHFRLKIGVACLPELQHLFGMDWPQMLDANETNQLAHTLHLLDLLLVQPVKLRIQKTKINNDISSVKFNVRNVKLSIPGHISHV